MEEGRQLDAFQAEMIHLWSPCFAVQYRESLCIECRLLSPSFLSVFLELIKLNPTIN